jgi:hypothetical protein
MDLVNRELRKHLLFVLDVEKYIFKNPKHLKGVESYNDKKTIDKLKSRVGGGKLLRVEDLQFLETIYEKY